MRKKMYNGMGSLVRRGSDGRDHGADCGDGRFYVIVSSGGKRKRHRLEALTLREARAEQARLFGNGAVASVSDGILVSECFRAFIESPRRRECGAETLAHYKGFWERFVAMSCKRVDSASSIKSAGIHSHLSLLRSDGLSDSTVSKVFKFLAYIFRILVEDGRLRVNPCGGVMPPRFVQKRKRELSPAEIRDVLGKADGWLKTLLYLGAYTGLRLGDCATLKWSEVDIESKVIRRIPNKTSSSSGSEVVVGIPASLADYLATIDRKGEYVVPYAARKYETHSWVAELSHAIQRHFSSCGISTGEKKEGRRKVTEVGFHSLRHSWITHQLEQGTPTTVVQLAVGHGTAQMTARYAHTTDAMIQVMPERGEYGKESGLKARVLNAIESADESKLSEVARLLGLVD